MLQSSDSALCVQTQQEGERGRLNLGPVPKWADTAWCQGSCGQGGGRTKRLRLCSRKLACTHPWAWGRGGLGGQSRLQTHGGLPVQRPGWSLCDLGQGPPHSGSWSLSSPVCEIHLLSVPSCFIATFSPSAPPSLCLAVWTMLVPEGALGHRTLLFHASVSPPKPFLPRA